MNQKLYNEWKKDQKKVRTYAEWQKAGRQVRRGERMIGRRKGVPIFHLNQTDPKLLSLGDHPDPWADNGEEEAFFTQIDSYFDDIGDR